MSNTHVAGGLAALLAFSSSVWADISGTVLDSAGAAVPQAKVYLLKVTQPTQIATANSTGAFRFQDAGKGLCTVFASAPGLGGPKLELPCDRLEGLQLVLQPSAVTETVVVTAERTELPSTAVASSASVLTSDDLAATQALQLFEAFRYLPGVEMNQTGRRGGVTSLFVRGADSKYNLITIDGVTVNDFGGAYNFTSLPADAIERVELVRGPQSALYGSYANGSAVQITTPSGLERRELFASAEGGNFATRRFTVGGGGHSRNFGLYAGLSRLETDGTVRNDDSRFDSAHLKLDHEFAKHQHAQYSFLANSNESGNPGAIGSDPARRFRGLDPVSRTFENYTVHSFRYDGELGSNIRERLGGGLYSDRLDFRTPFGSAFSRNSRQSLNSETTVALARHDLVIVGVDWQGERFRFRPEPIHRTIYGWFAENHFEVGDRLFLNAGVRAEHLRLGIVPAFGFPVRPPFAPTTITQVHPKLSAALLLGHDTRLHASYGTGLRPPNGFELAFTTNPGLKPERSTSYDAGIEQSFLQRRITVDVTWFHTRFRDQIVTLSPAQAGLSQWTSDNLARSEASGVETAVYLRPGGGLRLRGAYTYLDTEVLSLEGSSSFVQGLFRLGQQFQRRPRHACSYLAVWQRSKLSVETGAVFRGRTLDVEPNAGAGQFLNPFYATLDLGAQWELKHRVSLTAKIRNLLDRTYEESLGFPALGRSFTVGVKWRWSPE